MAYTNKEVQKKPNAAPAADVEPASKTASMVKGASGIDEQIQMLSPGGKAGWNGDQGAEAQLGAVQMKSSSAATSKASSNTSSKTSSVSSSSSSVSSSTSSRSASASASKTSPTSASTASSSASQAKKPV